MGIYRKSSKNKNMETRLLAGGQWTLLEERRGEAGNKHTFSMVDVCSAAAAKLLQSCPTLCDPIDSSPPGSPVPGILQARTLEWGAIAFSNA